MISDNYDNKKDNTRIAPIVTDVKYNDDTNYIELLQSYLGNRYAVLSGNNNEKVLDRGNKYLSQNTFDPSKLSQEEIKNIQQLLISEGYLAIPSKDMINNRSKMYDILTKNGYKYLASHKEAISRRRLVQDYTEFLQKRALTGLWDEDTAAAWEQYDNISRNWDNECPADDIHCARWVTKKYESVVGNKAAIPHGVVSNAWQMPMNVVEKGGKEIYNIYRNQEKPKNTKQLKKLVNKQLEKQPLDLTTLLPGDIVGINFPNSTHFREALKDGTTYNTHVGMVTSINSDGVPIVTHNMGNLGGVRKEPADNLGFSSNITVAVRPKGGGITPIVVTPKKSSIYLPKEYQTEEMQQFLNAAEGSLPVMKELFPNADPEIVRNILVSVLKRETNFMTNKVSDQGIRGKLKEFAKEWYRQYEGLDNTTKSSNLTKFKLSTLDNQARLMLGITKPEDLEIPHNAAVAGMYILCRNYDYLKRLQQQYPDLGITDEDIKYATISSYNQGMGKYYHLGFDPKTGQKRPQELKRLRYYADPNNKIWDISATDYRHFRRLGLEDFGDFLYRKNEEPHIPYIAAALEAEKLISRNNDYK